MSAVLHIPISGKLLDLIDQRAGALGLEREAYVLNALARHVTNPPDALEAFQLEVAASGITDDEFQVLIEQARDEVWAERVACGPANLDAILADVRAEFESSGMSEEDVAELVETARKEIWAEKRSAAPPNS